MTRRTAVLALSLSLTFVSTALFAQYWAFPAKTPNTDVVCSTCPDKAKGMMTPGYPATLGTYVGRYLDSNSASDCQQLVRTWRAAGAIPMPALNPPHGRIYFQIGSAVMAYDMDRFFQRVGAGETFKANDRTYCISAIQDTVLAWDKWYYAENPESGWDYSSGGDGQTRLYSFDVDDQGYIYLGTKWYRWGIVKDNMLDDGKLMQFQSQPGPFGDDVIPSLVVSLKSSNGTYYAVIGDFYSSKLNLFNVTDRTAPQKLPNLTKSIYRYAKNSDATVVGIATVDGRFQIYTTDAFVANGSPLVDDAGASGGAVRAVASDGTNFYVASDASSGLVITTYARNGSGGYSKVADFPTSRTTLASESLKWGNGYLVQAGLTDGSYELRLFRAPNVNDVSEVDLSIPTQPGFKAYYFRNYYKDNTSGRSNYVGAGLFGQFHDSVVTKYAGHTYLLVTAFGLGDVYDLPDAGSLAIHNDGTTGTPNPNRKPGGAAGPFYGDPIGFTATTGAPATNIQWDFGNAEAVPGADPNSAFGVTGQQIIHRYSGITSLPTTRTVSAASVSNPNVNGSLPVTLAKPSVSIGLQGGGSYVTQASQLSSLPIVAGDRFIDGSDGSVQSHYTSWSIDGSTTNALPSESVSVGTCAASHTLSFDGHYGPYTGTSPSFSSFSDLPIGIHAAAYSVRPFAAAIATAPSANSITFTAAVRTTGDTTILSAAQAAALQYHWQLIDASNNVLVNGPSGSGAVPAFTVSKSSFTSRGIRARLTLTSSTPVGGACAGKSLESADAYTAPLNGPDPVVTGDCTAGGPPCSFGVLSVSGVDQVADGWTYVWSVQPASFHATNNTNATFAPAFTAVGQYTVSVTATNSIGSSTASKSITVTQTPPLCQSMNPGVNVFVAYQSASGSCSYIGGTCSIGDQITFNAAAFGYDYSCDTHTFTWTFGDGAQGTGKTVTHTYNNNGLFPVSLTIRNSSQTVTTGAAVKVGSVASCPEIVPNQNVFIVYSAPSGCSQVSSGPCLASESISFAPGAFGYDWTCRTHSFQWNFGDGTTGNTMNVLHAYIASGTYNVSLTITTPTQTVTMTTPVKVAAKKGCSPLGTTSFFVGYNGPASQCTYVGDTTCSNAEAVAFNATANLGFDASCVTSYQWNFGDGSDTAAGPNVAHTFAAAGRYNVQLSVTDGASTVVYATTVKVRDDRPAGDCPFDFNAVTTTHAGEFVFTVTGATAPSYAWDFGDGSTATSTTASVTHTYADAKQHTVTLTVPGTNCRIQHAAVPPRRRAAGK